MFILLVLSTIIYRNMGLLTLMKLLRPLIIWMEAEIPPEPKPNTMMRFASAYNQS